MECYKKGKILTHLCSISIVGIVLNSKILKQIKRLRNGKDMTGDKEQKEEVNKKKIKVGDKVQLFSTLTVIRIRKKAVEELNKLPENFRNEILDEAVKLTMNTIHPYDVTLEDVLKAKKRKGIQK